MYLAMNRFKVALGKEFAFEQIWKNRETNLKNVNGFIEFHLIKGSTTDTYTIYALHSTWKSESDFTNWTKS